MAFEAVLDQAIEMLRRRGRVTYRALQQQFDLDEAYLADLKAEIIEAQRLAIDENNTVLVWTGSADPAPTPISAQPEQPQATQAAQTAQVAPAPGAARPADAERRQLTVTGLVVVGAVGGGGIGADKKNKRPFGTAPAGASPSAPAGGHASPHLFTRPQRGAVAPAGALRSKAESSPGRPGQAAQDGGG